MARKTWKWRPETRKAILDNCNGRCVACGCADSTVLEMDHIVPAGETTVENGQAMCGPCNRAKADVRMSVELKPFDVIDRSQPLGDHLDKTDNRRIAFARKMAQLRLSEDAALLEWARAEIGSGRRIASVIRSIAREHNDRIAKRVSRSL